MLSILKYLVKTLHFGLNGVHLGFFALIMQIFSQLNFFLKTVLNVWREINHFYPSFKWDEA